MAEPLSKNPASNPHKTWTERRVVDTWQIFRILAEFVEGFEKLGRIGPCVTIFGSARLTPGNRYYEMASDIAEALSRRGYGIITGGGPGAMEAGNRGAHRAGGISVGLNIDLPFEQHINPFVDRHHTINFDHFFVRKVMLVKYSQAFIVLPGGYGTLDELFEALTLIQTNKIDKFPIVLVGRQFWSGLHDWLVNTLLQEGTISPGDEKIYSIADSVEEVVQEIEEFYTRYYLRPNF